MSLWNIKIIDKNKLNAFDICEAHLLSIVLVVCTIDIVALFIRLIKCLSGIRNLNEFQPYENLLTAFIESEKLLHVSFYILHTEKVICIFLPMKDPYVCCSVYLTLKCIQCKHEK